MTLKDYEVIARTIKAQRATTYGMFAGVERTVALATIDNLAERMSRELLAASRFTPNGNKSFKVDKFLAACGVTA